LLICFLCGASVQAINKKALSDSLLGRFVKHPAYREQVKLLYNIIDLSETTKGNHFYNTLLFKIAKSHHDVPTQLDAIRNLNNVYTDSIIFYLNYVNSLPKSDNQKETAAFLRYQYALKNYLVMSTKDKSNYLAQLVKQYRNSKNNDIYYQAGNLMILLSTLAYIPTCRMSVDYMRQLGELTKRLPADGRNVIPNVYYALAPNFYSKRDMQKEALEADRAFLNFLNILERNYRRQGRIYRNFDLFRYTSYRRMLLYTSCLSQAEIKDLFRRMKELTKNNEEISEDLKSPSSTAYIRYYMATGQPLKAKPYLDNYLAQKSSDEIVFLPKFLKYRIQIGIMIHDKEMLPLTLRYIKLLEDNISNNINEKAQELQILYDVNGLNQQVSQLELIKKEAEVKSSRRNTSIAIIALCFVIILFGITFRQLKRSKKLAANLKLSQDELIEEKSVILDTMDKLEDARNKAVMADKMKTLFIQNMDHEIRTPLNAIVGFTQVITDPEIELEKEDKEEYMSLILKNNDLLLKLVNDVFDIAQMESGNLQMAIEPCSLNSLCNEAVKDMSSRTEKGVKMHFPQHITDFTLSTDRQRVLQLLSNYLSNACKFTHEGEIKLDYYVDEQLKTVTFSVTDTGIGIPVDKAEIIFNRFEKLNSFEQGTGLGLHVCRLIAKTLHGEVKLDTSYTSGSRFIFVHPIT
jgi:signal transduction histidine kinase